MVPHMALHRGSPNKRDTTMKLSHLAAFALAITIGVTSLGSSAHAGAFGRLVGKALGLPDFSWTGNKPYMDCLRFVGGMSSSNYPGKDENIRNCQRNHLPNGGR
jgi:hypothetical protein